MIEFLLATLAVTALSMLAARQMAVNKARSPYLWMLAAGVLGPLPLPVLAILPRRPERPV